jgi:RNA polymerase sigma factor (TIGR02999 family)
MIVPSRNRTETTTLLTTVDSAEAPALSLLVPDIYDELREMAQRYIDDERGGLTIQATELVHEAYLRLVDDDRVTRRGRAYFFGAAARAMRRVLIEAARRRSAGKRGGSARPVTLGEDHIGEDHIRADAYALDLLDLDRALDELERQSSRKARVVECRYFGGLSVEETAVALDVSVRTVKSDWALARAWLYSVLHGAPARDGP